MNIRLEDQELSYILNQLSKCPWQEVDGLIKNLVNQARTEKEKENVQDPPAG